LCEAIFARYIVVAYLFILTMPIERWTTDVSLLRSFTVDIFLHEPVLLIHRRSRCS